MSPDVRPRPDRREVLPTPHRPSPTGGGGGRRCRRVTVVVAAATWETLALDRRVEWLGWEAAQWPNVSVVGVMDDHPVDYGDPEIWDAHMAVFESGGAEVAPGHASMPSSPARSTGTRWPDAWGPTTSDCTGPPAIGHTARSGSPSHWEDILPAARAGLAHRIVVVGPSRRGRPHWPGPWPTTTALLRARVRAHLLGGQAGRRPPGTWSTGEPAHLADDLTWSSREFTLIASRQTAAIEQPDPTLRWSSPTPMRWPPACGTTAMSAAATSPPSTWPKRVPSRPLPADCTRGRPLRRRRPAGRRAHPERMTCRVRTVLRASGCPWIAVGGPPRSAPDRHGPRGQVVARSRFADVGPLSRRHLPHRPSQVDHRAGEAMTATEESR